MICRNKSICLNQLCRSFHFGGKVAFRNVLVETIASHTIRGLHFPVKTWDALTVAPFLSAPHHSAKMRWRRFFIEALTSFPDSVSSPLFSWSGWHSSRSSRWHALHT